MNVVYVILTVIPLIFILWGNMSSAYFPEDKREKENLRKYTECKVIIPLRRSRLSGKTETICPDRRKPLNLLLCAAKPHVCYCA